MGWHLERIPWASGPGVEVWHDGDAVPIMARAAWRPDEDDAQSLRLLERLVALGYECALTLCDASCEVRLRRGGSAAIVASDPDRRLACVAAALAVLAPA